MDKKNCTITLYNPDGTTLKSSNGKEIILPVGVGKNKGDKRIFGYAHPDQNSPMKEQGRYTAAGEFTLDELHESVRSKDSMTNYGQNVMDLKGDNRGEYSAQMAIHQVPETISKESRTKALLNDKNADGTLKKNRTQVIIECHTDA